MRIIYPLNPLNPKEADEPYQEEFSIMKSQGISCSLFDLDALDFDEFRPKPRIEDGETVLYRGWMLSPEKYQKLVGHIERYNSQPLTDFNAYIKSHHIVGWYDLCREFTPESRFYPNDAELKNKVDSLGWGAYFVKDYVKSNSTERGSIADSTDAVVEIVGLIQQYRGDIEGGIALRRVEDFNIETESRYFVFNGEAYSPTSEIPDIVSAIAQRIDAPFYSVDIIQRTDGEYRLVEIGDGQVSDKKNWPISVFTAMLVENANLSATNLADSTIGPG